VPATITSDKGVQFTSALSEAVIGSQLVLPGQFVNTVDTTESPLLSFLQDLQTTMAGCSPPPARHNLAPAPTSLSEELLLASLS
jgi:hypothetical protein